MKKLFSVSFIVFLGINLFSQSFDPANLRAGAGLCYVTRIDNLGLVFNGTYEITEQWEAALAFSPIFEKDYLRYNVLDMDGHYVFFEDGANIRVFGLAGLAFNFWKVTIPPYVLGGVTIYGETTTTGSDVGLNLGVGMNYKLTDVLSLAPEFRVTLSDGSFVRLGATLQYSF